MRKLNPPIMLLIIAVLTYGLLIPQLGFYWDDQPISWIRYQLGAEALTRYFSNNRPVWGLLYQITTHIFPQVPIYWQVFALLWRWLGAVVVWLIVRELWKDKPEFAFGVAALFLIYPGFNQQWGAFLYSHFFIVIFFFLLSIYLMLRHKTIAALVFSALNLWMMEYFFVLEVARIGFIWTALRDEYPNPKTRLKPNLKLWTPYLILFALAVLSRLFIFNNQVYGFGLMSQLKANPLTTIITLIQNFFVSLWTVSIAAWAQVFTRLDPAVHGTRTIALYIAVISLVLLVVYYAIRHTQSSQSLKPLHPILLGLFMLPFAGVPFWATGLTISLAHPASRFTLPFMLGVSLILAGLIEFIPRATIRSIVLAVLIGLAAGSQFLWSTDYVRDWQSQKNLFWQMTWRAPGLKPGTLVLMNEELAFNADNSISAPLNGIYASSYRDNKIDYVLLYPTNRLNSSLSALQPNIAVHYDYLAGAFDGNTSNALAFYYDPPSCLRLLDPILDADNHFIRDESLMREASALSNPDQILRDATVVMPKIYDPEPEHGWCYYFQKADLARQFGAWDEVGKLGNQAFKLNDSPNNPVERFVFIEGYAHVGNWKRALELSKVSYKVSKDYVGPLLCQLWKRIETETTVSVERSAALTEVQQTFACPAP
ncbi:MAG: hypothetical protein ABI904_07125 [Chloroflexota bacterium]